MPQASGGRKEYSDDEGNVTRVVEWFGFKLHLLVDVKHEVPLAYEITDTKAGDGETLPALVEQAQAVLPELSRGFLGAGSVEIAGELPAAVLWISLKRCPLFDCPTATM